jgi:Ca2+-binding RTX toxin-like protein
MVYNLIQGNNGNNFLKGDTNPLNLDDEIRGFDGDDILKGLSGNNLLKGGKGNDVLNATRSNGNNQLYGGSGKDRLKGVYGNNTFDGGTGFDYLSLAGSFVSNSATGVTMTIDNDDPTSGSIVLGATTTIFRSIERFNLSGTNYDDTFFGGIGDDSFSVGLGNDKVSGGAGEDLVTVSYYAANTAVTIDVTIDSSDPNSGLLVSNLNSVNYQSIERFYIYGSKFDDLLHTGAGDDAIYSYDGNDTVYGGAGNDYIDNSQGSDNLYGGNGNDTINALGSGNNNLYGEDGDDTLKGKSSGSDNIYGGAGNDAIEAAGGQDLVDGGTGDDRLTIDLGYYPDGGVVMNLNVNDPTSGSVVADTNTVNFSSIESFNVSGSDFGDLLFGGNGDDYFYIRGGDDTVNAGGGDDTIDVFKLTANDNINGGTGSDELNVQYLYPNTGMVMSLNSSDPTSGSIVTDSKRLDFSSIERFQLYGTIHDDILFGGIGNDTIGTKSGKDSVNAGAGYDLLDVDYNYFAPSAGIVMSLNSRDLTSGSIVAGANSVNFQSIEQFNLSGTIYDDLIKTGAGDDTINAGFGKDNIDAGAGNDLINLAYYNFGYFNAVDGAIDTVTYSQGNGKDIVAYFESGVGGDILSFNSIPQVDLVQTGSNTEVHIGDGISGNAGFGKGELLITLNGVTATVLTADNFQNTSFLLG